MALHDLSISAYLWIGEQVERVDRNETNYEHVGNELVMEWDHIIHTVPVAFATIGGWF